MTISQFLEALSFEIKVVVYHLAYLKPDGAGITGVGSAKAHSASPNARANQNYQEQFDLSR
jgi:hypothetical protein